MLAKILDRKLLFGDVTADMSIVTVHSMEVGLAIEGTFACFRDCNKLFRERFVRSNVR
jgi:hypothetical protein